MSNKIVVLWGSIVFLLVISIYLIGLNRQKEEVKLEEKVKSATIKYMDDNNLSVPLELNSQTLIDEEYLDELKLNNKACEATIKVTKKYIFKNYDIKFKCTYENNE